jgi:peptidoglycan/LPS O-acetylase OafA/YrhL
MRATRFAGFVAVLAGAAWITAGVLSYSDHGLSDRSEQVWWGGVGGFTLACALLGYSSVTKSPWWLRLIVFVGAAALGGLPVSTFQTDLDHADLYVIGGGAVVALIGLYLLFRRTRRDESYVEPQPPQRGGRRAAR